MEQAGQVKQPSQKLVDFNTELEALLSKYQYRLGAVIDMLPTGEGFVAHPQVFDVSPKVEKPAGVTLTPDPKAEEATPEVPADETKEPVDTVVVN